LALELYADECVDARIVAGLRRRGVRVTTAADEGLLRASDDAHLARAIDLSRAIITTDHDFLALVSDGCEHPGLLFVLPRTSVGDAIRAITLMAQVFEPAEMRNWIEWIP
jgi:predicted nuclease of predicted toxin-antitoxin system